MIKRLIKYSLVFITLLLVFFFFCVSTEPGLNLSLHLAQKILPGKLSFEKATGRLLGASQFSQLNYQSATVAFTAAQFTFAWQPLSLLKGELNINNIELNNSKLTVRSNKEKSLPQASSANGSTWPSLLTVRIANSHISHFTLNYQEESYFVNELRLSALLSKEVLTLQPVYLDSPYALLHAQGSIQLTPPYTTRFEIDSTRHLAGNLQISGDQQQLVINSQWQKPFQLNAKGNIQQLLTPAQTFSLKVAWASIAWPLNGAKQVTSRKGEFSLDGKDNSYRYHLDSQLQTKLLGVSSLIAKGRGNFDGLQTNHWQLNSANGSLTVTGSFDWAKGLVWDGKLVVADAHIDSPPYRLDNLNAKIQSKGQYQQTLLTQTAVTQLTGEFNQLPLGGTLALNYPKHIAGKLTLGKSRLVVDGSPSLPLSVDVKLHNLSRLMPALKGLNTTLNGQLTLAKQSRGSFKLSDGYYQLNNGGRLAFEGAKIDMLLKNNHLSVNGKLSIDANKYLTLTLKATDVWPLNTKTQRITLNSRLKINQLAFIDKLSPYTKNTLGQLTAKLALTGTIAAPSIETTVALSNAKTSIPALGIRLAPINLNANGNLEQFKIKGDIQSGKGIIGLTGTGSYVDKQLQSQLSMKGQDFTLLDTSDYYVNISPQLDVHTLDDKVTVSGQVTIPKAHISGANFNSSLSLPEEVTIDKTTKEVPEKGPLRLNYQVKAILGDDVSIDMMGLTGDIVGDIAISHQANQLTRATGRLSIEKGRYKAYGQKLSIDKGQLLYTGGDITNPGISLQASRKFNRSSHQSFDFDSDNNDLTVGVKVNGSLRSPQLRLFSNEASQTQADMVSLLVLGRTTNVTGGGGASESQLLMSALSGLNAASGDDKGTITDKLQDALGLSSLDIQTQSHFDKDSNSVTNSTSLVMSQTISKRLSLHYGIGLGQQGYLLRIKYLLTKAWSIQVESDDSANGVDIMYSYSH